jgi:lipopolysaccharide export system permease protein
MFFIGAPLGAIIRKGGLGLPIVFAILIFIIFHFINTFGKKVAQQDEITPFLGCWMSSFVLTPLAIILTKKATDDKGFSMSFDWFTNFFNRFFPKEDESVPETVPTIGGFDLKDEVKALEKKASKAPKKVPRKKEAIVIDKDKTESLLKQYGRFSLLAIIGYIALLAVALAVPLEGTSLAITVIAIGAGFYFVLYKSQTLLHAIGTNANKEIDLKTIIVLLGAFPFYPLFYLYNRSYLKEIQSASNTNS